jgi:hypothetical protein
MRTLAVAALLVYSLAACATDDPVDDGDTSMSEQALSSNEQTAFNYFFAKGLTKAQSAGIVGNLIQESSVIPTAVQYGGGPGRGIAQWSVGGRWDSGTDSVVHYSNLHGLNRWALNTQLAFIWYELTTYGYGYSSLKAATNVTDATVAFEVHYEICGACNQSGRIAYAKQILAAYGGGSSGGGAGCYSGTLGKEMPDNACVQSKFDDLWYQCSNGSWVDRWTDPDACNGVHPL